MLGDHSVDVVLLATDLADSRRFYGEALGLEVLSESDGAVTFACGGDSRLVVSASTTGTADERTQASFRVDDLAAELADLRPRDVRIVEYDTPELKTVDGVLDTGDALHAWIVDPGNNVIGIDQFR